MPAREHARRLRKTGRIFRELLGARRANGKEILTIGEGDDRDHLYTADTVHRAFSDHFDRHFGEGRKSVTVGPKSTLSSEWMATGRRTAKRFCGAQQALQTKEDRRSSVHRRPLHGRGHDSGGGHHPDHPG